MRKKDGRIGEIKRKRERERLLGWAADVMLTSLVNEKGRGSREQ